MLSPKYTLFLEIAWGYSSCFDSSKISFKTSFLSKGYI